MDRIVGKAWNLIPIGDALARCTTWEVLAVTTLNMMPRRQGEIQSTIYETDVQVHSLLRCIIGQLPTGLCPARPEASHSDVACAAAILHPCEHFRCRPGSEHGLPRRVRSAKRLVLAQIDR